MRIELLSDLSAIGYEIIPEGETILLRYQKPDNPPESVRQLIDELREHKAEALKILKLDKITVPIEKLHQFCKGEVIPFPPEWLKQLDEEQLERLAIMTVDGGLSDEEAINAMGAKLFINRNFDLSQSEAPNKFLKLQSQLSPYIPAPRPEKQLGQNNKNLSQWR
jgi:hypothetical protein